MLYRSLESMQGIFQSKLGKELDALWQKVIDYRDTNLRDVSYINKLKALKNFFLQNCVSAFKEIVWRNVGFHISDVEITNMEGESFCSWSFFDKGGSGQTGTFQIENIITADYLTKCVPQLKKYANAEVFTADELFKIADSFDASFGGIKEAVRMEMRKLVYSVIGFDVETAFLMPERLARNSGVDYLTAQEITGIMLHELGHTLALVEHAGDCYARTASFNYLTEAFNRTNADNVIEATSMANIIADRIGKLGDTQNAERLRKVALKLNNDYSAAGQAMDKGLARQAVGGFLKSAGCFFMDLMRSNMQAKRFGGAAEQKKKFSDIPLNQRLATWEERKADEYAVSHGYGAELTKANNKLGRFNERMGLSEKQCEVLNDAERLRKSIGFLAKMRLFFMMPQLASDYSYSLYPAGAKRFREMLNITIQKLKSCSTDSNYIAKYISDCDTILSICDNPNSREETVAKMYKGYDIFLKYVSIPSFIDWIVHGRVKREIEELVEDVNAIGNNLLTYYGFKIQQLASRQ